MIITGDEPLTTIRKKWAKYWVKIGLTMGQNENQQRTENKTNYGPWSSNKNTKAKKKKKKAKRWGMGLGHQTRSQRPNDWANKRPKDRSNGLKNCLFFFFFFPSVFNFFLKHDMVCEA